jgi:benzylsuccinate CoA-transferase BbsE subunit
MKPTPSPLVPGALHGMRVLDMTDKSCVYAAKILCDLGAEVIRIEPPGGDPMRTVPPLDEATGASMFYAYMNTNKRSVSLDLQAPRGRELFKRLVASADNVVESAAPGQLSALGVGYEQFADAKPALVWTSITAFGSKGPYARWTADDLISQAMGGLMTLTGVPDREPLRLFGEQSCFISGLHAAAGTLMAVWHALLTGEGQHVDVSIQECIAHTLESAIQVYTTAGGMRSRQVKSAEAGTGMFRCTDGEIFIFASTGMIATSWDNLVAWLKKEKIPGSEALDDPKWRDDSWRRTEEARRIASDCITRLTETRTKYEIYDQLQQRDILSAPMSRVGDLFHNPQLKFLDWFVDQPIAERMATWPGPPFHLSQTPRRQSGRVPAHGQDNRAVYCETLGVSAADLDSYARERTV